MPRRTEQKYQDMYCEMHGLPVKKQRNKGIDYFCHGVGYIEFVLNGNLELKDCFMYPHHAKEEPYKIVFIGKEPHPKYMQLLKHLKIHYEVFEIQIKKCDENGFLSRFPEITLKEKTLRNENP